MTYRPPAVSAERWLRAGATGPDMTLLAIQHATLTSVQRTDLAAMIAGMSDGDLAIQIAALRRTHVTPTP